MFLEREPRTGQAEKPVSVSEPLREALSAGGSVAFRPEIAARSHPTPTAARCTAHGPTALVYSLETLPETLVSLGHQSVMAN